MYGLSLAEAREQAEIAVLEAEIYPSYVGATERTYRWLVERAVKALTAYECAIIVEEQHRLWHAAYNPPPGPLCHRACWHPDYYNKTY